MNPPRHSRTPRRAAARAKACGPRGGFTLLELLAASAVSMLLLAVLLQLFGMGGDQMEASLAASDRARQARPALNWLAADLAARDGGRPAEIVRPGRFDGELLLLATDPRAGEEGARCLLRYYTAITDELDRPSGDATARRRLYRQRIGPQRTLELLLEAGRTRPAALADDPRLAPDPRVDDRLADRVGGFLVRGWEQGPGGLKPDRDGWLWPGGLIEVELTLLSEREAARLARDGGWGRATAPGQGQVLRLRAAQDAAGEGTEIAEP